MRIAFIALIVLAAGTLSGAARAWDAGPASCKHSECSGGATQQKVFVETDCKKYGMVGHAPHKSCPAGEDRYGGFCYRGCPAGFSRTAVCSCKGAPKWEGNTHLFVIDRALDLLRGSGDATAGKIAAALNAPACRTQWETGLWDVDDGASKLNERPSGALGSHFYNGAKADWFGKATNVITYSLAQATVKNKSGDARSNALQRLAKVAKLDSAGCYQVGLMLHYLTDMTQPMHTSGLAVDDYSLGLHPLWEAYVPTIQARFPAQGWDKRFLSLAPEQAAHETAVRSNHLAKKLVEALDPHKLPVCTYTYATGIIYTGRCFRGDANVDNVTGEVLRDAYQSTASFLYVALKSKI